MGGGDTKEDAGNDEMTPLKIGASSVPHAEILEFVKPMLAEQGIDLQITEYTDYVIPNTAVESHELDANYFQHQPYLDSFNAENGTHLVSAVAVHYEPMGIYAGKTASLDQLGDNATIAVPNDPTNEARALLLLQQEGVITLKDRCWVGKPRQMILRKIQKILSSLKQKQQQSLVLFRMWILLLSTEITLLKPV